MGAPVRWQRIAGVKFYRMGTTLIAPLGSKNFVVEQYSDGAGFEARVDSGVGLRMPIFGDSFKTRREALAYLLPHYQAEAA